MRRVKTTLVAGIAAIVTASAAPAQQPAPAAPPSAEPPSKILPDGTINVPAFQLPPSEFMSPEALQFLQLRARAPIRPPASTGSIEEIRAGTDRLLSMFVTMMTQRYPTDMVEQTVAGVPVRVFTPKGKPVDPDRVLINLHGGAFSICWEACSKLESMPIAALGGFRVISVNYRMAPEHKHPAAIEDIAKVYRELLKTYKPRQIGIYGCSAGGALTGQAASYIPANGLPQAGAIGIFGAGAVRFGAGDSTYVAGNIEGSFRPPPRPGENRPASDPSQGYFTGADVNDAVISPAMHLDRLAKFPPTLVITGSRAFDMSPAIFTNSQLLKAGVRSTMIVAEAQGHCFINFPQLRESQDAYDVIVRHFRENLRK